MSRPSRSPMASSGMAFRAGHPTFDCSWVTASFGSPDAGLLVSLLPKVVHVRGEKKLTTLVQLVSEESRALRPARDVVLARLLEVLLIEALRSTAGTAASPGLLRGLADGRLAAAIRCMHESPTRSWTVAELAKEASLSRSAFFERFSRAVGAAPMEYLLAWRMALAKNMMRRKACGVAEIAERVGYSSASTFSVAFTRYVGLPPTQYARGLCSTETPDQASNLAFGVASPGAGSFARFLTKPSHRVNVEVDVQKSQPGR